ncbi:MAG: DUF1801 domain-containing protein [Candidatus Paceibacterota bacterium]
MKQIDISVKEYIQGHDKEIQNRLYRIREIIFEQVPTAEENIKYKMPTVVYHGNLIHYAVFKNHIGIYPLPEVIETLKEELKAFRQGKGSIQFQNNEELPIELIKKIVKARVEEKENELLEKKNKKQENN